MDNERTLTVLDENNQETTIEVLDIFSIDKYPGKEYILYTKGEEEGDFIKTYISILQETETTADLVAIEDENEFNAVQDFINSNYNDAEEVGE